MSLPQLFLAYLLGSIPSAYLAGRLVKGIDIRKHGSGNMGATNVFRVLGPGPGMAVLVLDIAKGAAAVLLLPRLAPAGIWRQLQGDWWPCALGLAAVLGHTYTCFLGFKGGKGVATSLGVILALAPLATLVVLAAFGAVFGLSRMVSAGSLAGAAVLPAAVAYFKEWQPGGFGRQMADLSGDWGLAMRPVFWMALALAVFVWIRHIPNIRRILAGTELKIGGKKEAF
jgi:acyl phosphate:glycerol-3-phosphate acyltransferase